MIIKVLGSGCPKCKRLYENAKEAVSVLGSNIEVKYITDFKEMMSLGIMSTPALVINDKVVSMGRLLSSYEIEEIIKKA